MGGPVVKVTSKARIEDPQGHEHELLLQAWESLLAGVPTVYLSGPITTGPRFVAWYQRKGHALRGTHRRTRALFKKMSFNQIIETSRKPLPFCDVKRTSQCSSQLR